jgi:hypothetical protein
VHSTAVFTSEPLGSLVAELVSDGVSCSVDGGGKLSVSPGGWLEGCSRLTQPVRDSAADTASAVTTTTLLTLRMVRELKGVGFRADQRLSVTGLVTRFAYFSQLYSAVE